MKKNLLTLLTAMFIGATSFAQTAPDFTAVDCNGNSHNLYSELNAGKVIVLVWVMPCGACVGPSLTAYNIVQSYANPNVVYYLMDDAGNTACASVSSWASSNGIGTNRKTFSTSAIVENNYGGIGMPHVVVVGTSNHTIYFNGLNSGAGNSTAIQNAINTALAATGISEINGSAFQLNVSTTSSLQAVKVTYSIKESGNISLEMINENGQSLMKKDLGNKSVGKYEYEFDLNKSASGIYFMRIISGTKSQTVKFNVLN